MASEVRSFQVTIPAGTSADSPYTAPITFPPRVVAAVHWSVPPGPSGVMGWRLTIAGQPVIPRALGSWIIADNDRDTWQLEDYPDQGQWNLTGYNNGIYDHTVYLDFLLNQIQSAQATPAIIPAAQLSSPAATASGLALPQLPSLGLTVSANG